LFELFDDKKAGFFEKSAFFMGFIHPENKLI